MQAGALNTHNPGGHGPLIGCPPGGVIEQVPSAFFITPGIAVGVDEPDAAGVAVGVVAAGAGAGAGAGVAAGAG